MKVLPRPETVRTVLLRCADDGAWQSALAECLNSPHEVSGAAFLPRAVAAWSQVAAIAGGGSGLAAVRIEGHTPSVMYRTGEVVAMLGTRGETSVLGQDDSLLLWREIADVPLLAEPHERAVWRVSLTPTSGPAFAADVLAKATGDALFDWGGGLVWLALASDVPQAGAAVVRPALASHGGGHATLVRAPDPVRASVPVFEPLAGALGALTARVKESFDPLRVLNPGRMYAGI
jgi:glycolate oxidase FAD binding subunit